MPRHCATANMTATIAAIAVARPANEGKSAVENSATTIDIAAVVPQTEIQSVQPAMKPGYAPSA